MKVGVAAVSRATHTTEREVSLDSHLQHGKRTKEVIGEAMAIEEI